MTIAEGIKFLNEEIAAAGERCEKVGHIGETRYMKVLKMCLEILEDKAVKELLAAGRDGISNICCCEY